MGSYYSLLYLIQIHGVCWCMEYYVIILSCIYVFDYFMLLFIFINWSSFIHYYCYYWSTSWSILIDIDQLVDQLVIIIVIHYSE